jgi:hypothetical protein
VLTPDRWFEDRQLCSVVDLAGPFDAGWWLETPLDAVLLNSVSGSDDLAAPLTEWFERLRPGGVVGGPCYGVSTISPHSPARRLYYAVGGGICCREDPENRLVPGPTSSYDSSGVTRNAQVRSSILLPGSKNR